MIIIWDDADVTKQRHRGSPMTISLISSQLFCVFPKYVFKATFIGMNFNKIFI